MSRYLLELQAVHQRVESIGAIVHVAGQQLREVLLVLLMVLLVVVVLLLWMLLMMPILSVAVGLRRTDESQALVIVRLVARLRVRVRIAAAARIAEITASPGIRIEVNVLDGGGGGDRGRGDGSIVIGGIVRSILHQVDDGRRCSR